MVEANNTEPAIETANCGGCQVNKPRTEMQMCSACSTVSYCSVNCQRADWAKHKKQCKVATQKPKLSPAEVATLIEGNKDTLCRDDFEVIKKLGDGNFTEIFKVEYKGHSDIFFALKICSMEKVRSLRKETDIIMEKHALNKIKTAYSDGPLPAVRLLNTFKDMSHLYFVTEILDQKSEMWEQCRSFGLISQPLAKFAFHQVCQSIAKLHRISVIHRDVKPENMFWSTDRQRVVLIDLGSAEDLETPQIRKMQIDNDKRRMTHVNFVGTAQYMAPECVRNKNNPKLANDIWSLGCLLYQFETGLLPFRGGSDYLIFRKSTEADFKTSVENLSPDAATLITKCLQVSPEARPTIEQVLADPYFSDVATDIPNLTEEEQKLRTFLDDLIKRSNVHEFQGREAFETHFADQISSQSQLSQGLVEHFRQLAILFLFDEDPDHAELEAEKDRVHEESKAAYSRAAERMARDEANHPLQEETSSTSEDEDAPAKTTEAAHNTEDLNEEAKVASEEATLAEEAKAD